MTFAIDPLDLAARLISCPSITPASGEVFDVMEDALAGLFPVLGFYLLAGIEQAQRRVFGGALPIDYGRYFRMILDQLARVPEAARVNGLALLRALAQKTGARAALDREIAQTGTPGQTSGFMSLFSHEIPVPAPIQPLVRAAESLSHLMPGKVVLDLKRPGLADIHGASLVTDRLLGSVAEAELGDRREALWRGLRWRGFQACRDIYFFPKAFARSLREPSA